MAKIVTAMATTHGPQLHTDVEKWHLRVLADKGRKHPFRGKELSFDELVELRKPEGFDKRASFEAQKGYHARCHAAMDKLADKWDEVKPDIAVILGNDQNEIYETDQLNPAFMVFYGDKIPHHPQDKADLAKMPPGVAEAEMGHAVPEHREYKGVPDLGLHIINALMENEFDVTACKEWPRRTRNGASHAFGHIYRQVMRDKVVPNVPIYQNTFYPPNQPTARRSYRFGQIVGQAIASWKSDLRVAVFASGGMSHFVIDEDFDRKFVTALKKKDKEYLSSIPLWQMQSGTSELKSWISLAGLLEPIKVEMHELDYVPCYRSLAGSGTANGFYWWDIKG